LPTKVKHSIETIVSMLPKDVQVTLGILMSTHDQLIITEVLATLPMGQRLMLKAYDVIEEGSEGLELTKLGHRVATECYVRRQKLIDFRMRELEDARAKQIAGELPNDLQYTLAAHVGATDSDVELTLALLPMPARQILKDCGVLQDIGSDPLKIKLGKRARRVINWCSILRMPGEDQQRVEGFRQERSKYYEDLP
jgi:hypothetical protein